MICDSCKNNCYVINYTCSICAKMVCHRCIELISTFYKPNLCICHLCLEKVFVAKITSPGEYKNVSLDEKNKNRINPVMVKTNNDSRIYGTCLKCKKEIHTLINGFMVQTHYYMKNKKRYKCEGSRRVCVEIRETILAGDLGPRNIRVTWRKFV